MNQSPDYILGRAYSLLEIAERNAGLFPQANDVWLPNQAAKFLKCKSSKIKQLVANGKMGGFYTDGGHVRVRLSDITEYLRKLSDHCL